MLDEARCCCLSHLQSDRPCDRAAARWFMYAGAYRVLGDAVYGYCEQHAPVRDVLWLVTEISYEEAVAARVHAA